jgi:hypothetical protein
LRREDPDFIPPKFSHATSAKRLREEEESNMRAKRERVDEDDEEMDIDDDDDDDAGPPAPIASNSSSCIISYCVQLLNRVHIIMFDYPFSTSAAFQQVALFKPPAGGHKWCLGSVISTVRIDGSVTPLHNSYLAKPSGTGVFRRRKSSRLQNLTQVEKKLKQQKLSLRTRSLPQLQDRCLMASSSRKDGTWLSRFYHRQAGLVVLLVNLQ